MSVIYTTLCFPARAEWVARTSMLDRERISAPELVRRLVLEPSANDVVVLDGAIGRRGGYLDRVVAAGLARRRHGPRIVITDSTWAPTSARRAALRLFDSDRTTYCVLSTAELQSFPEHWGVARSRVSCTPFYWTLSATPAAPDCNGQGVFAGGDSLRDYDTLLAAARQVRARMRIATTWRPPDTMPDNVMVSPESPVRFLQLIRDSSVVVVPLRAGLVRSAGQQTYLNAMALGKVCIATDAPGVRDHIDADVTGLIVPPADPGALAAALAWATDPRNAAACRAMGWRAHRAALERFSPDHYVDRLLSVIDAVEPR